MLNKLLALLRQYDMLQPGDSVTCAVSGGADSIALLWAMHLLRDKLGITVSAAHFNHHLRGAESDRDEAFVRAFCAQYEIPLFTGSGEIHAGAKGLEAAAREARYGFFNTLPGKIATAHTANDNAETVLMHQVRGTGLKGLGGIAPVRGRLIRPMLLVTREQVLAFLEEYHLSYVEDSSNDTDQFLRNRLRRHVVPLLASENPRFAENLSAMALRLREDEAALEDMTEIREPLRIQELRTMRQAQRSRVLAKFLQRSGVREPEAEHIALAERLVFSDKPSAAAHFPGGVTLSRSYDNLMACRETEVLEPVSLSCPGSVELPGLRVTCAPAEHVQNTPTAFTARPVGKIVVRPRQAGDEMRLPGGTRSLKKLFIDRKIPARQRMQIPVVADDRGVLGVYGIGANLDRLESGAVIQFETVNPSGML